MRLVATTSVWPQTFDLVVAHYTLSELCGQSDRELALDQLWGLVAEGGVLVVCERGNRWGFRVVKEARQQLILSAMHILRVRHSSVEAQSAVVTIFAAARGRGWA